MLHASGAGVYARGERIRSVVGLCVRGGRPYARAGERSQVCTTDANTFTYEDESGESSSETVRKTGE